MGVLLLVGALGVAGAVEAVEEGTRVRAVLARRGVAGAAAVVVDGDGWEGPVPGPVLPMAAARAEPVLPALVRRARAAVGGEDTPAGMVVVDASGAVAAGAGAGFVVVVVRAWRVLVRCCCTGPGASGAGVEGARAPLPFLLAAVCSMASKPATESRTTSPCATPF